jgi:hypothetical protein
MVMYLSPPRKSGPKPSPGDEKDCHVRTTGKHIDLGLPQSLTGRMKRRLILNEQMSSSIKLVASFGEV